MATVQAYISGQVCEQIQQVFSIFDSAQGPLNGNRAGDAMLNAVSALAPQKLSIDEATALIQKSKKCATGHRVCRAVHKGTPLTEAVFLDELAQGMTEAGKATLVTKDEAIKTINAYRKSPIIVSKVSGKYQEICPTWPKKCLYWNMEKHKLKCIDKKKK